MWIRACTGVTMELRRDASRCTLITTAIGPPTTWEEAVALLPTPVPSFMGPDLGAIDAWGSGSKPLMASRSRPEFPTSSDLSNSVYQVKLQVSWHAVWATGLLFANWSLLWLPLHTDSEPNS